MINVVQANPGFFIIEPVILAGEKPKMVHKEPIIAWVINVNQDGKEEHSTSSFVEPVCVDQFSVFGNGKAMLNPEGVVEDENGGIFDDVASWLNSL